MKIITIMVTCGSGKLLPKDTHYIGTLEKYRENMFFILIHVKMWFYIIYNHGILKKSERKVVCVLNVRDVKINPQTVFRVSHQVHIKMNPKKAHTLISFRVAGQVYIKIHP